MCTFISGSRDTKHLKVSKLDQHLDVTIRGALVLLDQVLTITVVGKNGQLVVADEVIKVGGGSFDVLNNGIIDLELKLLGSGNIRTDFSGTMINLISI